MNQLYNNQHLAIFATYNLPMESNESFQKYGINYGIIFGAYSALVLLLSYYLNYSTENWIFGLINFIVTVGIAGYAVYEFRQNNALKLSVGQAVKIGLIVGVVGGLIYAVYMYIHYTMIDTAFIENMQEQTMKAIAEQTKGKSQEEIDMAKKGASIASSPFALSTVTLFSVMIKTVLVGVVTGLVFKSDR